MRGNVHAWEARSREYGRLKWFRLFEAAVRLSGEGFIISEGLAGAIERAYSDFPEKARAFYGKNGSPLKAGDTLIQKDLGRSLRLISDRGAEAFYRGEISAAIDRGMQTSGGLPPTRATA